MISTSHTCSAFSCRQESYALTCADTYASEPADFEGGEVVRGDDKRRRRFCRTYVHREVV